MTDKNDYKYGELQKGILTKLSKDFINFKKAPKERKSRAYTSGRLSKLEEDMLTSAKYHEAIVGGGKLEEELRKEELIVVYDQINELYMDYRAELVDVMVASNSGAAAPPIHGCGQVTNVKESSSGIRLPRIDLPKFNGSYVTWRSFHDKFQAIVHNNKNLDDIDKLHFLQSCLEGDASRFLQNISIEAASYEAAWNLLIERYDHKRILVHIQMQTLFGQPSLTRETISGLKDLLYTTRECVLALKNMNVPVSSWDTVLIWFMYQKLPNSCQRLWEEKLGNRKDLPNFNEFTEFLETRFRTLEVLGQQEHASVSRNKEEQQAVSKSRFQVNQPKLFHSKQFVHQPSKSTAENNSAEQLVCRLCNNGKHNLRKCQSFLNMNVMQRRDIVRQFQVCENCLYYGHLVQTCYSVTVCSFCQQRHHSLLHIYNNQSSSMHAPQQSTGLQYQCPGRNAFAVSVIPNAPEFQPTTTEQQIHPTNGQNFNCHTSHGDRSFAHQVLLPTAVVKARAADGKLHLLRALIDSGSETSFITAAAAQLLKLERRCTIAQVSGLGLVSSGTTQSSVEVRFASRHSTFETVVQALVFKSLTGHLPTRRVVPDNWDHIKNLKLADPYLFEPAPIDLLLGSDVCAEIFLPEIRRSNDDIGPIAQNTHLGWIVLGKIPAVFPQQIRSFVQITDLNSQLERFWEIEEVPFQKQDTEDNIACEESFKLHTKRLSNGRYEVALPFREKGLPVMGLSRQSAFRRFLHLEKKLDSDPKLYADYTKCIQEYKELHHMEEIDVNDAVLNTPFHYFLPHHAVFKEASSTTKLRVVFDAAAKTSDGKSLNDRLLVGPKLQSSIIDLVLKWRTHRISFTADIEKMYRQIFVNPLHQYYQIIMWREQKTLPIKFFKMKTVTFGTASAPYLAIKILKKVADDEADNFPLLRKWTSNSQELIKDISIQDRELNFDLPFNMSHVKTLGIKWFPIDDFFSFHNLQTASDATTKRSVLSTIAKLFDPLGWISPCIITAKLMIQRLWELGCDWDDPIPEPIKEDWDTFHQELPSIERLRISRWVKMSKSNQAVELHGFCDASTKAYGAAVYVRVLDGDGNIHVNLLLSKTKVAPNHRTITLPRLELCGAVILAQLLQYTKEILSSHQVRTYAWTDSSIALAWIRAIPTKWTTFVSNRVSEIQRLVGIDCWGHVATHHNPADIASRGVYPSQIESIHIWWNGPDFLRCAWEFNTQNQLIDVDTDEEKRKVVFFNQKVDESDIILQAVFNCSSLLKVVRVIAICLRFIEKCRPKIKTTKGALTLKELDAAHILIVKAVQKDMFKDEIQQIALNKTSKNMRTLNAFIDDNGIIRVGGRLENSLLPYEAKHPIILRNPHHFTSLVVRDAHKNTLHGGIQEMINYIRQRYWIGQIRRSVKHQLHKCISCYRQRAFQMHQLMGNLPSVRVRMSRPFSHTGVDYAGPIEIKSWKARGAKILKGYFAIFICLSTKAIHLKLVSDLTTQAFLAAFRRFTARRGSCSQIYSDCGTNFVGANNELSKLLTEAAHDWKEVAENMANHGTNWHFIPPAGVKSVKHHLKRVVGIERLTFEELATLLSQIEACLNSRPLCPLSDSIDDLNALTPAHFLIGESLHAVPQGEINIQVTHIDRWKRVQAMAEVFWRKWNSEYLARLQQRPKWTKIQAMPRVGDLVLLKDERLPSTFWNLARIEETHAGSDGLIRVVTVKTQSGRMKRPITKICLLPSNDAFEQTAII